MMRRPTIRPTPRARLIVLIAVLGSAVADWAELTPARAVVVGQPRGDLSLLVPGEHNRLNATMAIATAEAAGVAPDRTAEALEDFAGLPHRLQLVADHNDVRFFNDSKSTTPASALLAIHSFEPGRVRLIAGGYDKQADLTGFARQAAERCAAIYTLGQTGDAIADAAETVADHCAVHRCGELEPAVRGAIEHARPGDVVLLSPACASWDQFDSFEQRGRRFAEHVLHYATPD